MRRKGRKGKKGEERKWRDWRKGSEWRGEGQTTFVQGPPSTTAT